MEEIVDIYKKLSLPFFSLGFIVWISLIILLVLKKYQHHQEIYFLITTSFLLGLFISRLMTLTIVDATTSASGIAYSASIYLFIYIFSILMIIWIFEWLKKLIKNSTFFTRERTRWPG